MTAMIEAIEELATCLMNGDDADVAIAEIAEEFGVPAVALRNRFVKAHGEIETFAARQAEIAAKIEADAAGGLRKIERAEVHAELCRAANDLRNGRRAAAVNVARVNELMDRANELAAQMGSAHRWSWR
jgi:flagellar biosynthesis GTPase FlhF